MNSTRTRRSGRSRSRRSEPVAAGSLADLLSFWRGELPRLGYEYTLRMLYTLVSPCPICDGQQTYQSTSASNRQPCCCRLQSLLCQTITGWQDYSALPAHLQHIERADILALGQSLTPTQRIQLSLVLKAVDRFVECPSANQLLIGATGAHGTLLAAYISRQLGSLPNVFLNLRQLIDWLINAPADGPDPIRDLLFNIPVLLIDDFSDAYSEIDENAARRLSDLVDYRAIGRLPVVVVSDVMLDMLWALHPTLLERLQQDADTYIFDHHQIRVRRPARHSMDRLATPALRSAQYCHWLGMSDGSDSSGVFPVPDHHCRRISTPQPIAFAHQSRACLSADHTSCPVFQVPDGQSVDALPDGILRIDSASVGRERPFFLHPAVPPIIAGLVLVLVVGGLMVLSEISSTTPSAGTPRVTAVPTLEPSRTPLSTATLTILPATPAVTTLSPTPGVPDKFKITVTYIDISVCSYPDLVADYTFLLAGTRITITHVTDGTVYTGSYDSDTGNFRALATHSSATENMSGRLVLRGEWLEVQGEHQTTFYDEICTALWSIFGRAIIARDE